MDFFVEFISPITIHSLNASFALAAFLPHRFSGLLTSAKRLISSLCQDFLRWQCFHHA